jgi:hypothetical protein
MQIASNKPIAGGEASLDIVRAPAEQYAFFPDFSSGVQKSVLFRLPVDNN